MGPSALPRRVSRARTGFLVAFSRPFPTPRRRSEPCSAEAVATYDVGGHRISACGCGSLSLDWENHLRARAGQQAACQHTSTQPKRNSEAREEREGSGAPLSRFFCDLVPVLAGRSQGQRSPLLPQ